MHKKLLVPKYTAIRQIISIQIRISLNVYAGKSKNLHMNLAHIHLHKVRNKGKISYATSVAFILSKLCNMRATEVAEGIGENLSTKLGGQFFVNVNPSGLIKILVSDQFIANWLDSLISSSSENDLTIDSAGLAYYSPTLFTAQYCHARWCSLLRLGERERLIRPCRATQSSLWLDEDEKIRCDHQTTSCLISELVQIVDWLYDDWESSQDIGKSNRKINWEKNIVGLVNTFTAFWADCRILGTTISPELAQMRFNLIFATKLVLEFLLLNHLGIAAPKSI